MFRRKLGERRLQLGHTPAALLESALEFRPRAVRLVSELTELRAAARPQWRPPHALPAPAPHRCRERRRLLEVLFALAQLGLRGIGAVSLLIALRLQRLDCRPRFEEIGLELLRGESKLIAARACRAQFALGVIMRSARRAELLRHRLKAGIDFLLCRGQERRQPAPAPDQVLERLLGLLVHVCHLADAGLEVILIGHGPGANDCCICLQVTQCTFHHGDELYRRHRQSLIEQLLLRREQMRRRGIRPLLEAEAVYRRRWQVGRGRDSVLIATASPRALPPPRRVDSRRGQRRAVRHRGRAWLSRHLNRGGTLHEGGPSTFTFTVDLKNRHTARATEELILALVPLMSGSSEHGGDVVARPARLYWTGAGRQLISRTPV
eukprot:scaffold134_cov111-Isochrysis_galbana.AAC.6